MLPTMDSRKHFSLTVSMISHSCFVLLASRETSSVKIVSPASARSKSEASCVLLFVGTIGNAVLSLLIYAFGELVSNSKIIAEYCKK